MDLNLFDFSGRSTVGGQRRNAKDRPPKKDMLGGRFQERPLSNTPMRPAGPIRRTCGVIKLPVMYYPLRPPTSAAQLVTSADPQVVLGSVVQQLWVRRLSTLHPIDSISGEQINPDSPPPPPPVLLQENNGTASAVATSAAVPSEQQSASVPQPSANVKLPAGINAIKSPPINAQLSSIQNSNLRMTNTQQPPSLPNHYTANSVHMENNSATVTSGIIKPHSDPTTATPQQSSGNNAVLPLFPGATARPVAAATGASPQGYIPIQQNGQGLLLQPNNVVYMQLSQQGAGKGNSNFSSAAKATATLQMVQQLPQGVPQQGLNHSFITESEIRLQEQKVQLLRKQLGLTS